MEGVLDGIHLVRTPCFRVVCEFVPLNSRVLSSDLKNMFCTVVIPWCSWNSYFKEFLLLTNKQLKLFIQI